MNATPAPFYTQDALADLIRRGVAEVGAHTYGAPEVMWANSGAKLRLGKYTSIAAGCRIFLGGNHRPDWVSTYPFSALHQRWPQARGIEGHPATKGDVVIGSDVWIGAEAFILSGVSIGHGAVVGARAVVSRDAPPYAIVAGNPARVVRMRFDARLIERLVAIAWWDWPDEVVAERAPLLLSGDVEGFCDRFGA
ncbi:MAG: CatB-related O-acetyltransferase [Hyphomicrobiales bacterium]|nr:CatB-related O-acetyltransferase [Hyphomicrobiales bacterium]